MAVLLGVSEGRKAVDISEVEVGRQCAVEDDTQTLSLRGGGDQRGVVYCEGETGMLGESGLGANEDNLGFIAV